jgi:hypothetical protein
MLENHHDAAKWNKLNQFSSENDGKLSTELNREQEN